MQHTNSAPNTLPQALLSRWAPSPCFGIPAKHARSLRKRSLEDFRGYSIQADMQEPCSG